MSSGAWSGDQLMELKDLPFWSSDLLELECDAEIDWRLFQDATLMTSLDGFLLSQGGDTSAIKPLHRKEFFEFLQQRAGTQWLIARRSGTKIWVQWLECVDAVPIDLNIGVTEVIAEALFSRGLITQASVERAITWLETQFLVQRKNADASTALMARDENSKQHFRLFGAQFRLDVRGGGSDVEVVRVAPLPRTRPNLVLATGDIQFVPQDLRARLNSPAQQAAYEAALRDTGNYLKLWDEYSRLQINKATQQAREVGWFQLGSIELLPGDAPRWRLLPKHLVEYKSFVAAWREQGLSPTALAEISELPPELDDDVANEVRVDKRARGAVRGQLQFNANDAILTPSKERYLLKPATDGYVALSLAGDVTVQRRREDAKGRIDSGAGLAQLKYLIEGVPFTAPARPRIAALSRTARDAFTGAPNPRQIEALEVALNTPDIALIVGPPGTGKTQVIAALQRRLAELIGADRVQHQLLVTSYQHDAVDNALSRIEVYGLPSLKVGSRKRTSTDATDPVAGWTDRLQKRVRLNLDELLAREPLAAIVTDLRRQFVVLRLGRFGTEERRFELDRLGASLCQLEQLGIRVPPDLMFRWESYLTTQASALPVSDPALAARVVRAVRALRTSSVAAMDDGADRADDLLRTLRRAGFGLTSEHAALLERAADDFTPSAATLDGLADLKSILLEKLLPDYRPPEIKQALNGEGLQLLTEIESSLEAPLATGRRSIASVLVDYSNELEGDPKRISDAVSQYAIVVGATCQQAAGEAMSRLQSLTDTAGTSAIQFDTVVVDEAARANPLDLFIPISMARRRIILVGDHRQLPHLLEPDLERELAETQGLTDVERKAYEVSLFQRLMSQLQGADGPKRVVVLNEQYRMHPVLGDFVSREFYEKEGLEPIRSPRPAEDFPLDVPGFEGKACVWMDVHADSGTEQFAASTRSRYRECEARRIAERVSTLVECRPDLSVGVITFYAAQRDQLRRLLIERGMLYSDEDDGARASDMSGEQRARPRVEVGTVDAFQGKEFDVVFLSIVRSSVERSIASDETAEDREKRLNRRYGHLRLSNRMNVAMSRQRRLLVVAGDRSMAEGDVATQGAPALASFLALCMEQYGAVL